MENLLLNFGAVTLEWHTVALSLLMTFLCSSSIAWTYERTFRGLSWSVGLLQTMVLGSLVATLVMIAIGDNVARGIGIVGSLAIIRFRTNLRDPRDLAFLFGAMGVGIANGVQSHVTAMMGTVAFCGAALALQYTGFGQHRSHDGLLRFQLSKKNSLSLHDVMKQLPASFALVTMRPVAQADAVDYAYQVTLKHEGTEEQIIHAFEHVEGLFGLSYINQRTTVEL